MSPDTGETRESHHVRRSGTAVRAGKLVRVWSQRALIAILAILFVTFIGALGEIPFWTDPPLPFKGISGRIGFYVLLLAGVAGSALLLRAATSGLLHLARFEELQSVGRRNIAVIPLSRVRKLEKSGTEICGNIPTNRIEVDENGSKSAVKEHLVTLDTTLDLKQFLAACLENFRGSSWETVFLVLTATWEENLDYLDNVVFIGSEGPDGSAEQFAVVISSLREKMPWVTFHEVVTDPFDLAITYSKLNECLRRITAKKRFRTKRLVLDVTGGSAAATIACTLTSMSRNQVFTYAKRSTNEEFSKLMVFDVGTLPDDFFLTSA